MEAEAGPFADFLFLCLHWDPDQRITAERLLAHPWLTQVSEGETRMSEEEFQSYL